MAKKYYAVKAGRSTGVFESWDECKNQVMSFSGAVYKSFTDRAEAERFVQGSVPSAAAADDSGKVKIYVDGSFDKSSNLFSYGVVVLAEDGEVTFNKAFNDPEMAEMRNVSGEIYGAMAAMRYCMENGISAAIIYHDYEGIAKWPLREWKANKKGTKAYVEYYDKIKDKVSIEFRKVKGHSGDKYNDMVDALAKQALGIG